MSTTKPEALRLADALERPGYGWHSTPAQCAAELRRQHARIAELEAQLSSSGFTTADMATAAAQGFRDGVASVAAGAGSEPVAVGLSDPFDALRWGANVAETLLSIGRAIGFGRAQQILGEQWEAAHGCAPRGRMGVTVKDEVTCQMCGGKPYPGCNTEFQGEAACRFTHPSPPEGMVGGWRPIETAPKDGRTVIVGRDMGDFGFVRGYGRFEGAPGAFRGGWISHGFSEHTGDLGLAHPTHWMPLPPPPTTSAGSGKGE